MRAHALAIFDVFPYVLIVCCKTQIVQKPTAAAVLRASLRRLVPCSLPPKSLNPIPPCTPALANGSMAALAAVAQGAAGAGRLGELRPTRCALPVLRSNALPVACKKYVRGVCVRVRESVPCV